VSGWAGSTRRQTLPPDWAALRRQILERDGYRCTWELLPGIRCNAPATDVDHIDGHRNDPDNLRSLCMPHHRSRSSSQGGMASGAQAKRRAQLRYRPAEQHPGLVS
jgi:5-methylcytosine-specific restriction enzyme A